MHPPLAVIVAGEAATGAPTTSHLMLTPSRCVQAHPSLVVTVAGAVVTAAPITGYLTLVLTDVTDSTFVMDTIPGNVVRTPALPVCVDPACLPHMCSEQAWRGNLSHMPCAAPICWSLEPSRSAAGATYHSALGDQP